MILMAPDQHMWVHQRWKSRPRFEREDRPFPERLLNKLRELPWMDEDGAKDRGRPRRPLPRRHGEIRLNHGTPVPSHREELRRIHLGIHGHAIPNRRRLGTMNIHPQTPEGSVLYGPGVTIEPMEMDGEVQQMMLTHVESEIAWFVTERILRTFPWKLRDLEDGREIALMPD